MAYSPRAAGQKKKVTPVDQFDILGGFIFAKGIAIKDVIAHIHAPG